MRISLVLRHGPTRHACLRLLCLATTFTLAFSAFDQTQARAKSNSAQSNSAQSNSAQSKPVHSKSKRPIHGPNYHPPYAAIVIDDKSGLVLQEEQADEPRRPASLTKIMTLYILFEQIEAGKFKLEQPLSVSAFAAHQRPVNLGLKANSTIKVEEAILALCTKSANDAAVVIAEAIGGSEEAFAGIMTANAHALGMASTTYINASGLPAEQQLTTARDQALLGRAIQHRFPGFYRYFSTRSFNWKGKEIPNHNALLGSMKGIDGIKTGYTQLSGYNLTASIRRDSRHLIGVIMGGTSNAARNARMRELLEKNIGLAATEVTAPRIVEMKITESAPQQEKPATIPAVRIIEPAPQAADNPVLIPGAATRATEAPVVDKVETAFARGTLETVPLPRPRMDSQRLVPASFHAANGKRKPIVAARVNPRVTPATGARREQHADRRHSVIPLLPEHDIRP